MARPTKRTAEREARIIEAIGKGATRKAAAVYGGIDEATLYRWIESFASFASLLARAEADVEVRCTGLILDAAAADPKYAEWWLERRRSEDYGRREKLDVSVTRREAERMAEELGLSADAIMAEAERIVSGRN